MSIPQFFFDLFHQNMSLLIIKSLPKSAVPVVQDRGRNMLLDHHHVWVFVHKAHRCSEMEGGADLPNPLFLSVSYIISLIINI